MQVSIASRRSGERAGDGEVVGEVVADQVLDREKNPEWQGECTKLVYEFPTNTKLWDGYAQERAESLRMGHGGLSTAAGDPGCLSLPGRPGDHSAFGGFADHVAASEYWVRTEGRGRTVNEWTPRPGAPDNHWLDCLVGCAAAASTLGVSLDSAAAPRRQKTNKRKRKNVSYL